MKIFSVLQGGMGAVFVTQWKNHDENEDSMADDVLHFGRLLSEALQNITSSKQQ